MEYPDDGIADAGIDVLPDQLARHGIPGAVDLELTIGSDAAALTAANA
jgi:hypothetical protein